MRGVPLSVKVPSASMSVLLSVGVQVKSWLSSTQLADQFPVRNELRSNLTMMLSTNVAPLNTFIDKLR